MAFSLSKDPNPCHKEQLKLNRNQLSHSLVELENRVRGTAEKKREGECRKGENQRKEVLNSIDKLFNLLLIPKPSM